MSKEPDLHALAEALAELEGFSAVTPAALRPLPTKGLAHDHLLIGDTGWLLRVPKQSQFGLAAETNLRYQEACFERVGESGRAPRIAGRLEPGRGLPMGALVVRWIEGRVPRLPDDLSALAESMARVHALPLPAPAARAPLERHEDPVGGILPEIERQAGYLEAAGLEPAARRGLEQELAWARDFADSIAGRAQPVTLVLTDTHPGNFLIDAAGRAIIVDLEKALYGSPGIDLAHATVYSSTTWDPEIHAELSLEQVAGFYRHYLEIAARIRGAGFAASLKPWLLPMRRLLFLRAITWCAMWRVRHREPAEARPDDIRATENWSAEKSDPRLIAHVAGRVDCYLEAETIERMRGEWLEQPDLQALI